MNNEFVRYLSRENFHLLAGINLPLVIDLFMSENDGNTTHTIMTALADSKENIQYCNQTITSAMQSDKDFKGGSVMIVLRVDHRLLHGQVAFSRTQYVGADCILIANDSVPNDDLRKTTIKMAKPPAVKLVIKKYCRFN